MKLFRLFRSLPTFAAASVAGTLALWGCDEGATKQDNTPKAGDRRIGEYGVGDKLVERTTYRFHDLEEPGVAVDADAPGNSIVSLTENVEVFDKRLAPPAEEPVNIKEVREFLRFEWDRHIGGVEDAGVNAREFVAMLDEIGLDVETFM